MRKNKKKTKFFFHMNFMLPSPQPHHHLLGLRMPRAIAPPTEYAKSEPQPQIEARTSHEEQRREADETSAASKHAQLSPAITKEKAP